MQKFLLTLAMLVFAASAQTQTLTACDWETGHPSDPDRVGPGRSSGEVDTHRAIDACRNAVSSSPDTARFHYQLGRALVYAADREGSDWRVGMPHLVRAAEMQHTQAQFVLGLLYQRDNKFCEAEPWTRRAAGSGLKSARIAYVSDYLAGLMAPCEETADLTTMRDYLEGAGTQVTGWYENMLLENLKRSLDGHSPSHTRN